MNEPSPHLFYLVLLACRKAIDLKKNCLLLVLIPVVYFANCVFLNNVCQVITIFEFTYHSYFTVEKMSLRQDMKRLLKVTQLNSSGVGGFNPVMCDQKTPFLLWGYVFLDKFNLKTNYIKILCYGDEWDNECKIALKDSRNINELSKLMQQFHCEIEARRLIGEQLRSGIAFQ